jgi:hypothetical protein
VSWKPKRPVNSKILRGKNKSLNNVHNQKAKRRDRGRARESQREEDQEHEQCPLMKNKATRSSVMDNRG